MEEGGGERRAGGQDEKKFASDVEMHDMVSFPAGSQGRGEEGWCWWWWEGLLSFFFFSFLSIRVQELHVTLLEGPGRGILACSQLRGCRNGSWCESRGPKSVGSEVACGVSVCVVGLAA